MELFDALLSQTIDPTLRVRRKYDNRSKDTMGKKKGVRHIPWNTPVTITDTYVIEKQIMVHKL